MTFNYFRAFYLAKAGTELGLTEVYNRGDGFEWKVTDSEHKNIITNNFLWEDKKYEAFNPAFTMEIKSIFQTITNDIRNQNCNDNEIILKEWEWIMLSLFKDTTSDLNDIFTPWSSSYESYKDIQNLKFDWIHQWTFTFWLFGYDDKNRENMVDFKVKGSQNDLSNFLTNNISGTYKYLTIKNSWNSVAKFCISSDWEEIPYSSSIITVRGNYGDMEVWLESVVKKSTPSRSLDVLWWENP